MKVMKSLRVVALAGLVALPAGVAAAQDQDKSLTTTARCTHYSSGVSPLCSALFMG